MLIYKFVDILNETPESIFKQKKISPLKQREIVFGKRTESQYALVISVSEISLGRMFNMFPTSNAVGIEIILTNKKPVHSISTDRIYQSLSLWDQFYSTVIQKRN